MDRATKRLVKGSRIFVDRAEEALEFLTKELARVAATAAVFCVDGPFRSASVGKVRLVEQLFMRGAFASSPSGGALRLRLSPAGTAPNAPFLLTTQRVVGHLAELGYTPITLGSKLEGAVVEIFPTLFMASLLSPYAYVGARGDHTDELWGRLRNFASSPTHRVSAYAALISQVENSSRDDLHDGRAAALSAIAADWYADAVPGTGVDATMFIGTPEELGFLLPPRSAMAPDFMRLLEEHWAATTEWRRTIAPSLVWL